MKGNIIQIINSNNGDDGGTGTTSKVPISLLVESLPNRLEYVTGDILDLTGLDVVVRYSDDTVKDVTDVMTTNLIDGSEIGLRDNYDLIVSYTENNTTVTRAIPLTVKVKIVSWSSGSDKDVVRMVEAADRGMITLSDHWKVGDERSISLSAMSATYVGESQPAQTVKFVLMNIGGKDLVSSTPSGRTKCSFIVGMKNTLTNPGYINSTATSNYGWSRCARRSWCNNIFYNAIPSGIKPIFKQFKNCTSKGGSQSSNDITNDYFALPAYTEVTGSIGYSQDNEARFLYKFTYYNDTTETKYVGNTSTVASYWTRSPYYYYSSYSGYDEKCWTDYVTISGSSASANSEKYISPFGVI